MKLFEIDIVDHHWIDRNPDNTKDECSHGRFLLTINGQIILGEEDDVRDWTTCTSVLRLLRTIDEDFLEARDFGVLLHCGGIEMISCPISIDWLLWHEGDMVCIKEIKKYLTWKDEEVIEFPGLTARISKEHYVSEVVKVATQVKDFFRISKPREYFNETARRQSAEFWKEFDLLTAKHS